MSMCHYIKKIGRERDGLGLLLLHGTKDEVIADAQRTPQINVFSAPRARNGPLTL